VHFLSFFVAVVVRPFSFPVLSCFEYGCLMPLCLSEVA